MNVESYYENKELEEERLNESFFDIFFVHKKKFFVVLLLLLIFFLIFFFQAPSKEEDLKISINGNDVAFSGSLTINDELVDTFSSTGRVIIDSLGVGERGRVVLSVDNSGKLKLDNPRVVLTNSDGIIVYTVPPENIIINPDGTISFDIDFSEIDFDFVNDEEYEFNLQITFTSDDGSEVISIEIPYHTIFQDFVGEGCLLINRSSVSNSTRNGFLEIPIKLRVVCDSYEDLEARVNWFGEIMGNVEIIFSNNNGSVLTLDNQKIFSSPAVGEYDATIFYIPNKNSRGKVSEFSVNIFLGDVKNEINFLVSNENLEQCLRVELIDSIIENDNDFATIRIDSSACASERINIILCDNNPGCSGGTLGSIDLSMTSFQLTPASSSRTINVFRGDIPGLYGVSVHASLPGNSKTFISEEEIFVKPTNEIVFPKEFSVSLIGGKDSIRIRNNTLVEDVEIETSICNLYNSSMGTTQSQGMPLLGVFINSEEWVNDLYNNDEKYSGRGFYQKAFFDILPSISQIRTTAYNISVQENEKIKQAYTSGQELNSKSIELEELSDKALEEVIALRDELAKINQDSDMQTASQIASILTSITALITDITILTTSVEATNATVQAIVPKCPPSAAPLATAKTSMATASSTSKLLYAEALQLVNIANNLYSLYQRIDSLTKDAETIDAESSVRNSEEVNQKLQEVNDRMYNVLGYLDLALQSASIDSLDSVSKGHSDSADYFEIALLEMEQISRLKDDIIEKHLDATDDLTVLQDTENNEKTQLIIEGTQMLLSLIQMTGLVKAKTAIVQGEVKTAQTSLVTAISAATTGCSNPVTASVCCDEVGLLTVANSEVIALQAKLTKSYAVVVSAINVVNTAYQAWQFYESLTADYLKNLIKTLEYYQEIIDDMYSFELLVIYNLADLDAAIKGARNLSSLEKNSSMASTYIDNFYLEEEFGSYNRNRLVGLIGTLISNSFVNGAYDGGVYTTKDTTNPLRRITYSKENDFEKIFFSSTNFLKEDCDNMVRLKLPSFKTNLWNDAKQPILSTNDVTAYWSFQDLEVFDVFEEQEASIVFANTGLKKNSYVTLQIPVMVRNYSDLEKIDSKFSPFNIPSKDFEEKIYSFQIKVNAEPRTGAPKTTIFEDSCQNGLFFGSTGEKALPKILLDWEWNNIDASVKKYYLDATQFSILLSKQLSILNNFLEGVTMDCPKNYAFDLLDKITPKEFNLIKRGECFLPLTTRHYDGKPALYYFLDKTERINPYEDPFFNMPLEDVDYSNNAEKLLSILDLDVFLIRDGYGLEFQSDFANYFSQGFLKASPDFVDSSNGMYRYFNNSRRFFYTSEAIDFKSSNDFVLPDAGLYEVKPIIDFTTLPLISGGTLTSNIKIDLRLKEPINVDYSPFYYTPFDGGVGLRTPNDRRYYGSSLSNNSELQVSMTEPVLLKNDQRDSIIKINSRNLQDFYFINSFASKKGRILDYSFADGSARSIFSPTIATPLLFNLEGVATNNVFTKYAINRNERVFSSNTNNLLFLTGVKDCGDFFGGKISDFIIETPDFVIGDGFGFGFPMIEKSGKTLLTSTIFAPINNNFAIEFLPEQKIMTTNDVVTTNLLPLEGIKGMPYNDLSENSYIRSLNGLFDAVKKESVCVTRFGDREIYYWSNEKLFSTQGINEQSLQQKINVEKQQCIR